MASITEFLEARIAEDERQFEVCRELGWYPAKKYGVPALSHDRLLAECAAKRAIIERAQKASEVEEEFDEYLWAGAGPERVDPWNGDAILFALAAVYKDHEEYRQEWA